MHFIQFISSGSGPTTPTPTTAVTTPTEENESPHTSIVFVILVIAVAIIVSASIYLLLRYLNRRRSLPDSDVLPTTTTVSFHHYRHDLFSSSSSSRRRVSPDDHHIQNRALIESLPLFSFDSVKAPLSSADCAVCLSKFEPRDQLRLLPLCCHAFHAFCVDTWLVSNRTCPLCRSTVVASDSEIYSHLFPTSAAASTTPATDVDPPGNNSFRLEIGTVSRRRLPSDSGDVRRSYSLGSFEYIVDHASEVFVAPVAPEDHGYRRGASDCEIEFVDDKIAMEPQPPGASLAAEVASGGSGRYWLRGLASSASHLSLSSRRSSGRFFTGSNRRIEGAEGVWDWEANRIGEEISELFRWFSGV